jgi:hypothetical protein
VACREESYCTAVGIPSRESSAAWKSTKLRSSNSRRRTSIKNARAPRTAAAVLLRPSLEPLRRALALAGRGNLVCLVGCTARALRLAPWLSLSV